MKQSLILIATLGLASMAASSGAGPESSRSHTIEISGMKFLPDSLDVERGDTVVWINRDIFPHTSTGLRKPGWDSGVLQQGKEYRFIATRAGREDYRCELHPTMLARLIVH